MKTSRYTETQILAILRQAEGGMPVAELCRALGMCSASFYKWRAKYGGMDASLISQMKAMDRAIGTPLVRVPMARENRRLKRMYADLSMQADLLKEALGKNGSAISTPRDGRESGGAARCQHCAGLQGLCGQRDLLSLQPEAEERERGDCRSARRADRCPQNLGLWPLFPAPAQREGHPCVRRLKIWNRRPDFGAESSGSSGSGYAAWR